MFLNATDTFFNSFCIYSKHKAHLTAWMQNKAQEKMTLFNISFRITCCIRAHAVNFFGLEPQYFFLATTSEMNGNKRKGKTPLYAPQTILWNPMFKSEDIEMRTGRVWCQTALKTRLWWALMDWQGLWELYRISNMWMTGSTEPDEMYKPSGDQAWVIRAECESLLSCFHPKEWISACLDLKSNKRSCFSKVLQWIRKGKMK